MLRWRRTVLSLSLILLSTAVVGCNRGKPRIPGVVDRPYLQKDKFVVDVQARVGSAPQAIATFDRGRALVATGDEIYVIDHRDTLTALGFRLPEKPIRSILWFSKRLVLLGPRRIWIREGDSWRRVSYPRGMSGLPSRLVAGPARVWAIGDHVILRVDLAKAEAEYVPLPSARPVADITFDPQGNAYVLTDRWIFRMASNGWQQESELPPEVKEPCCLAFLRGSLWVGTPTGLWTSKGVGWEKVDGKVGLPYEDVTCLASSERFLWAGTSWGLCCWTGRNWEYYASRRYLPDDHVRAIVAEFDTSVWVLTANGVSHLFRRRMSLAEKARLFERRVEERHDRFGLVAECGLRRPGDLTTWYPKDNDNDGLWTGIYLAAQCFRYAVTGDTAAKRRAIHTFEAMERLERITGIPGFPARSYVPADQPTYGGEWHLTPDGKWKWKGDTSSDEIVGHLFAYPIFYDLIEDEPYRKRARDLICRIVDHIIEHNYHLVDVDGKPTRWGVWNPDSLNKNPNWRMEQGLNSLEILSFLRAAYHVSGDPKYMQHYERLARDHHYAENTVYQKKVPPDEVNHSDDELAFLPYYILFRYEDRKEYLQFYRRSMERSWAIERPEHNPLWNFIASVALGRDCGIEEGVATLRDIPLDLVKWRVRNSHRKDIRVDSLLTRFGQIQNQWVLPASERAIMKWNGNPYLLDDGGDGREEDDGGFWLLPYWMGRYHGFIIEENQPGERVTHQAPTGERRRSDA